MDRLLTFVQEFVARKFLTIDLNEGDPTAIIQAVLDVESTVSKESATAMESASMVG